MKADECEQCGKPATNRGVSRFCSRPCWFAWEAANIAPNPKTAKRKRAYGRWYRMVDRCTNPSNKSWHRYGGRGIYVDPRWMDFDNYYTDTGDAPDGMTLDRVDNNGPYMPGNVRWATAKQQRANIEFDPMRSKTQCKQGHAYDEKNTQVDARGWRSCRACQREKMRRRRAS